MKSMTVNASSDVSSGNNVSTQHIEKYGSPNTVHVDSEAFGNAIIVYEVAIVAGAGFLFRRMISKNDKAEGHGWRW